MFLKIKQILITTLILLLIGCASMSNLSYKVSSRSDEFEGYTFTKMENNNLVGSGGIDGNISLNASKYEKDGLALYSLIVVYRNTSNTWLFIEAGESLILLIDGQKYTLISTIGSLEDRDVVNLGAFIMLTESAMYQDAEDVIRKIGNATSVKVKVKGKGSVERNLSKQNMQNFKDFISTHMQ
jgi:hypothetical protein